jgi:large subunit ribosomal protein L11
MKAAGLKKGSNNPKAERVAEITAAQVREIAQIKLPDLNAYDVDTAMRIISGTARSIGITVVG